MYSASDIAVDKGLGFDFSGLVKSAATVGLGIYNKQMELKQTKALAQTAQQMRANVPVVNLPSAQMYAPQPTFGAPTSVAPTFIVPPRAGMDMTMMLMIGAVVLIGGTVLMRVLR